MSAVPLSSPDSGFSHPLRQLRLLDGGEVATGAATDLERMGRPVPADGVDEVVLLPGAERSLAEQLHSLAATHTCFCCGAAMHAAAPGATLRCAVCGAETEVVAAA
jgi:hypothetical protein